MEEFRIYVHPSGQMEAVKIGWSWPGAVLVGFWALYKKLWLVGGLVLVVSVLLHGYLPLMSNIPMVFDVGCAVVFGYFGNSWRDSGLVDRGYEVVTKVAARTPEGAIALYLRNCMPYSEPSNKTGAAEAHIHKRVDPKF